jgi:hypothetical protein
VSTTGPVSAVKVDRVCGGHSSSLDAEDNAWNYTTTPPYLHGVTF